MPATTRSAPTTAVASRASKASKANKAKTKAPKGKTTSRSKPNATTNRVQKPTSSNHTARGYVYVDKTSRTVSPDFIAETPPPSQSRRRVIEETPPPYSQADYEAEIARLHQKLRHRRHQSRRRSSRKGDSEDESEDSEAGDRPRVSFLHHAGNKPFLTIHEHYPAVNIKYFKQIYYGNFQPSKSMRLAHNALAWSTTPKGKKDKDEVTPDPADMVELLRTFEVYAHAICFFAARPRVALELHDALVRYRIRLMDFSLIYRFESVRTYHYAFMGDRILMAQDDPVAWITEDYHCRQYLIPRPPKAPSANAPARNSAAGSNLICHKWNAGNCHRTDCKYPHICSVCQQSHPANQCRSRPVVPNSNSVPLSTRSPTCKLLGGFHSLTLSLSLPGQAQPRIFRRSDHVL